LMGLLSTPMTHKLNRDDVTLSGRLLRAIRGAILDGTLPPGRHLSDRELCKMFDVSRGLIREAIQTLASEELVTVVPHRGAKVTMLDRNEAQSLYRVRAVLEGLACEEFTINADDSQRADLFAVADQLASLTLQVPPEELITVKNTFYMHLLAGCRNDVLAQMFTQLNNRILQLRRLSLSHKDRLPDTIREMVGVVAAIRARDAVSARRLAEAHVAAAAAVADARFAELEINHPNPERKHNNG
jgi:DNA-binding GntR family transcriptional regulator